MFRYLVVVGVSTRSARCEISWLSAQAEDGAIDVEKLAEQLGAEIVYGDLDGAKARVVQVGERARIIISKRIAGVGAIRFCIARARPLAAQALRPGRCTRPGVQAPADVGAADVERVQDRARRERVRDRATRDARGPDLPGRAGLVRSGPRDRERVRAASRRAACSRPRRVPTRAGPKRRAGVRVETSTQKRGCAIVASAGMRGFLAVWPSACRPAPCWRRAVAGSAS